MTFKHREWLMKLVALDASLAAAVGNDPSLVLELRAALIDGARHYSDLLARSRCDANWTSAAHRLKGLAASFGAISLIEGGRSGAAIRTGRSRGFAKGPPGCRYHSRLKAPAFQSDTNALSRLSNFSAEGRILATGWPDTDR